MLTNSFAKFGKKKAGAIAPAFFFFKNLRGEMRRILSGDNLLPQGYHIADRQTAVLIQIAEPDIFLRRRTGDDQPPQGHDV